MIVSEITIKHQGKPPRRVMLVRFSPAALNRVLAEAQGGFWGRHAETIRREMARA